MRWTRHVGAAGVVIGALALGRLARYEIRELSMHPALDAGDWVIGIRRPRRIRRGDVVVLEHPEGGMEIVKRIAALPGDPIPGSTDTLGPDRLWVLGDNSSAGSVDSRTFGPLGAQAVRARILVRYRPWPPQRIAPTARR